jgi:predicted transcriptional regulator
VHEVSTKQEPTDGLVSLSVRITPELAAAFKEIADREDRPVAAEMRRLIRQRVDDSYESSAAA